MLKVGHAPFIGLSNIEHRPKYSSSSSVYSTPRNFIPEEVIDFENGLILLSQVVFSALGWALHPKNDVLSFGR
eukprot:CAMPEP_0168332384 /NCGR_PEP_ID=MMETSP0213-20121227/8925_1 /TAXON_ID=151035 /ORGANISM="Euplotes harpa, Strain FSP1.4" /LENGTH=72 /DNA_ID=CAMNT_0008336397 /DNA_START=1526 /DNA_END=1741 /DNA_ORIENTATION=+